MKKLLLIILLAATFNPSQAQIRPRITKIRNVGMITMKENLLDNTPGFKRSAIAFVPLVPDVKKGYDPEKIYQIKNNEGVVIGSAKGKDILDKVNEVEKSLNERGHSLREKTPFIKLNLNLPLTAKNDFSKCLIQNNLKKSNFNTIGNIGNKLPNTNFKKGLPLKPDQINSLKSKIDNSVYSYVGVAITNAREFRNLYLNKVVMFDRAGSNISADLMLYQSSNLLKKTNRCIIELSESVGGVTITTLNVPIKNPNNTISPSGYSIDYTDCIAPPFLPQDFYLNMYKIDFSKSGYNFPAAGTKPKYYYATLKYYDAANNLLDIYQPNQVIFNNQLPMPMNFPTNSQVAYNGFDYELTDPGLHAFGFYAKSEGFSASYFSQGEGYYGITKKAAVNADMNIGVKYFNFKHLVSSNEPLSDEFVLFSYKIKSEENFKMADAAVPRIRIPGAPALKSEDPDYGVITLLDKEYNLASTDQNYFKEDINIPVTDMRFFIGPIPCRITVNIRGEVSVTVDYQSSTQCDIKAVVNPHASVTLSASGGVDAFNIAYAKIVANVNLLTVDMPYNLQVNNTSKTTSIAPTLTIGGLAGQIYFQAGLCIPIPFIDDICTDFRIDILNWKGLEKSLVIDPQKGIVL